ncbi:hypothetical protein, partial [Fischerella sp.]|uniref:hypothetical protein n=1 Tax=Fischerella sp. TaxID=1191 RepID=UPI0025BC33C0
ISSESGTVSKSLTLFPSPNIGRGMSVKSEGVLHFHAKCCILIQQRRFLKKTQYTSCSLFPAFTNKFTKSNQIAILGVLVPWWLRKS